MATGFLTAKEVSGAKPASKRLEIAAGPMPLYLIVQPSGSKSWAVRYRWKGKPRKLTLGGYPAMSLAQARKEAGDKLSLLGEGKDPAKPDSGTFKEAWRDYYRSHLEPKTKTHEEAKRQMEKDVLPHVGGLPLAEVGKPEIRRVVEKIVDRGAPVSANKTQQTITRMFSWLCKVGTLAADPLAGLPTPGKERTRDRVLTLGELSEVWKASESLGYPIGPFVQLLTLTGCRRGEVAGMRWEHVDLDAGRWTVPAELQKSGKAHVIPLSGMAADLLRSLPRFEGDYVFSTTSGSKPLAGFSKAKKRLDAAVAKRRELDGLPPVPDWRLHDLRRSAATHLRNERFAADVIASVLGHSLSRMLGVSGRYIQADYEPEKREALEAWAELLRSAL